MRSRRARSLILMLGLGIAGTSFNRLASAQDANGNWREYHGDYRGWRFSPMDSINKANVSRLHPVWIHQPGGITQGLQTTPIVVDGVIYYSSGNDRVSALNSATGEQIWQYIPDLSDDAGKSLYSGYSRGVAVGHGKVLLATFDGRLIALDQASGKVAWDTRLTSPTDCNGCNFTSPPVIAGDVIIVGSTGGDLDDAGHIYGVGLDGKTLWTFNVLKDDVKSWPSSESRKHGGGGAWMPGQYDPTTGMFYIGTANAAPDFRGVEREGDNLYTSSILALEPKTGQIRWVHQEVPHDVWDFDSANESVFIDKDGRQLMAHLNKGGFVSVLDRKSGTMENVWKFAEHADWVETINPKTGELIGRRDPSDTENKTICPSAAGARSWNPGAYDPTLNLWFSNGTEACMTVRTGKTPAERRGFSQPYYEFADLAFVSAAGTKPGAWLAAFDPLTGAQAWKVRYKNPALGGILATAGGLTFNGDSEGFVHAYESATGKELWSFNTGSGIRAGIISYKAGERQFILVPSGFGSLLPGFFSSLFTDFRTVRGGAALIAFAIDDH